jgi:hypothetical protein
LRILPIALCMTSLFSVSSANRLSFVTEAGTQTQTKSQTQSKEALYVKCREEIFRKYGQPGVQYGFRGTASSHIHPAPRIDQCVANGGRVD